VSQLTKVRYDKSTTKLDPKEENYWMHFLQGDPIIGDYIKSQMRHNPQMRREILNQPVCPKCEKFCFYHKGGAQCPTCGTWTPENSTHKAKIHLAGGYYR
jgi:hypothetical protein